MLVVEVDEILFIVLVFVVEMFFGGGEFFGGDFCGEGCVEVFNLELVLFLWYNFLLWLLIIEFLENFFYFFLFEDVFVFLMWLFLLIVVDLDVVFFKMLIKDLLVL